MAVKEIILSPYFLKTAQSIVFVLIVYFISLQAIKIVNRSGIDLKTKHKVRKLILYISTAINLLILGLIWVKNIRTFSILLSVIGAGLVIALQDVIMCIAGWLMILVRKPYDVGDRIEIGGVKGDVIDIRLFQTTLLEVGNWVKEEQSTGRIVNIPNKSVFLSPIFNYTKEFEYIWNEIKIVITFESNWKKAKQIMLDFGYQKAEGVREDVQKKIKKMAERYLIFYDKLTPIVYVKIVDYGIELSLRYLTTAKNRRNSESELYESILNSFQIEPDINFAYPTYRIVK
jgi:small-conductance mechanosensitive channel